MAGSITMPPYFGTSPTRTSTSWSRYSTRTPGVRTRPHLSIGVRAMSGPTAHLVDARGFSVGSVSGARPAPARVVTHSCDKGCGGQPGECRVSGGVAIHGGRRGRTLPLTRHPTPDTRHCDAVSL